MEIADLVAPAGILPSLKVSSKKQALQELAKKASDLSGLDEREIFDALLERERLGTTGVGMGIAIPHSRFGKLTKLVGLFARLDKPIPFDSVDEQPVDLADHLKALARVSRLLRDKTICAKLRGCDSADAIYALLTESQASAA
jgi:PTS system nitrogen regulatory IIA component